MNSSQYESHCRIMKVVTKFSKIMPVSNRTHLCKSFRWFSHAIRRNIFLKHRRFFYEKNQTYNNPTIQLGVLRKSTTRLLELNAWYMF